MKSTAVVQATFKVSATLLLTALVACSTPMPHQSEALTAEITLKSASLLSVVPPEELSVRRDFVASKANAPLLGIVCLPCVAGAVASTTAAEKKSQAQEDAALLPALRERLGDRLTRTIWEDGLRAAAGQAKDIAISEVQVVSRSAAPSEIRDTVKTGGNRSLAFVEVDYYLSQDLNKFRMQARARLFDEKGKAVLDQYYFFLPPLIAGATKAEAIGNWSANSAARYRRTADLGVNAILDALQLTLLSYRSSSSGSGLEDASSLLDRRSCYAGDFEVGIPLSAYEKGKILASRDDYSIVRLANNDVLVIPICDT